MQPFDYIQATEEDAAITTLVRETQAKLIAGGTNLLDLMKGGVEAPRQLIDINQLPLTKVETLADGGVRIGALARNSDVAYAQIIRTRYPMLSEALLSGASPQLRNMATVGGNLMQRTRCYYFNDPVFPCNKRVPGSGCPAISGYNRIHAILGTSDQCIATHPSDMCVALAALDAVVHTQGRSGKRSIPITEFYILPEETPHLETVLKHEELITAVDLPAIPFTKTSHYLKVRDRADYEFALVSVAVALDINNGVIDAARVALGGVGTKPWRSYEAEEVLVDAIGDEATFQAAAEAAVRLALPSKYNAFKVEMLKGVMVQALTTVASMAGDYT